MRGMFSNLDSLKFIQGIKEHLQSLYNVLQKRLVLELLCFCKILPTSCQKCAFSYGDEGSAFPDESQPRAGGSVSGEDLSADATSGVLPQRLLDLIHGLLKDSLDLGGEAAAVLLQSVDGSQSEGGPLAGQGVVEGPHGDDRVVLVLPVH